MKEKSQQSLKLIVTLIIVMICGYTVFQLLEDAKQNDFYLMDAENYSPSVKFGTEKVVIGFSNSIAFSGSRYHQSNHLASNGLAIRANNGMPESSVIDFPNNAAEMEELHHDSPKTPQKGQVENSQYAYTYNSTQQNELKSSAYINISNSENVLSNVRDIVFDKEQLSSPGNFPTAVHTFTNTKSSTFLTNNSLTLSTDLSTNNSPMLVDGGSNPGDPNGVPIGDGKWILLAFVVIYGLKKKLIE